MCRQQSMINKSNETGISWALTLLDNSSREHMYVLQVPRSHKMNESQEFHFALHLGKYCPYRAYKLNFDPLGRKKYV